MLASIISPQWAPLLPARVRQALLHKQVPRSTEYYFIRSSWELMRKTRIALHVNVKQSYTLLLLKLQNNYSAIKNRCQANITVHPFPHSRELRKWLVGLSETEQQLIVSPVEFDVVVNTTGSCHYWCLLHAVSCTLRTRTISNFPEDQKSRLLILTNERSRTVPLLFSVRIGRDSILLKHCIRSKRRFSRSSRSCSWLTVEAKLDWEEGGRDM